MRPLLLLPCLLLAAQGACAQAGDAPSGAACGRALQALQGGEEAAAQAQRADPSAHRAALARLQPLRERAARACLQERADDAPPMPAMPAAPGMPGEAPAPRRPAQPPRAAPPVSVPPLAYPAPGLTPVPLALPAPPPRVVPPASITGCDALGCWASDGTRLQRAAPGVLLGPRGFCSAPGGLLHCP